MTATPENIAQNIYDIVGPASNIEKEYNCMTRLRLILKTDPENFKEKLTAIDGVLGTAKSGPELQIILGPGRAEAVETAFKSILEGTPLESEAKSESSSPPVLSSDETTSQLIKNAEIGDGKALHEAIREKNKTPIKLFLSKIASIFLPLIPAFIACGLITGLTNVAIKISPDIAGYPIIKLLGIIGNAVFYGMNLFVGYNAAQKFGGSPILGGVLAAIISHPGLADINLYGENLTPGRGGIIAVLITASLGAVLEVRIKKVVPDIFKFFLTPLLVILIMGFAAIFILQPSGGIIAEAIANAVTYGISYGSVVTGSILGGTYLPIVMLGLHQAMTPIHAQLLASKGINVLLPILAMAGAGQAGAAMAVYFKTKNPQLKKIIASALPVGILGIGEPLIYGVTLPLGRPFISAGIGGACGGAVQAYHMVGAGTMGISGLPLAAVTDNIPIYLLGLLTAYVIAFIATWIIGFDDPAEPVPVPIKSK